MSGPWEDFASSSGPWADFKQTAKPLDQQPIETPSRFEQFLASLPDSMAGNLRGSAVGRLMQGAADPGVALVQGAANLLPNSTGIPQSVNKRIADEEKQYQGARASAGSDGFDPMRAIGNTAMTLPLATVGSGLGLVARGAVQGAGFGALQPVTNGGDSYWKDKAKEVGIGAAGGALTAPIVGAAARLISPNASVNPAAQLLREEGVQPTLGQSLGGAANALEEKAQSLPIMGPFVQKARQAAAGQLQDAAYARAADPIGATIAERGNAGIGELSGKIGQAYEEVLPKLSVNILEPGFVDKMSSLRSLVSSLPEKEAQQFDNVISREIDGRVSQNGTLTGQNLKDAWNALRDNASNFSKSNDAYQSQLGKAFKQAFQELKDQVASTNAPADVLALKNTDFAYANFKRLQRAAASVGADEGNFTPAQLQNAVKAMDRSKDHARFAEGDALMQDLSAAGKSVLTNRVPDSGTATRTMLGGLVAGAVTAPAAGLLALGAGAYAKPVQNALAALVSRRPDIAPQIANYLRRMTPALTAADVPMLEQRFSQ